MKNENNKNVLAILKQMVADGQIAQDVAEKYFPELAESEDEKIRKALIFHYQGDCCLCTNEYRIDFKDIRAWLEKQGESYTKRDVDDAYLKGVTNTKNEIEKQYEANYQIRKDIATFIFNYKGDIKDRAKWIDYLGIKVSFVEKQGEQKPADKVEPKFHEGDMIIHKELGGDYIHNPHKIIQVDILDKKYRLEGGLVSHFGEQDDYELVEQKPAKWSEEDESNLQGIIDEIKANKNQAPAYDLATYNRFLSWLKSIKDRVLPQPMQEWSEDDEEKMNNLIQHLKIAYSDCEWLEKTIYFLKSLKEKYAWKPSDEQMLAINTAVNVIGKGTLTGKGLIEIQEQLKKLIC